MSRLHFSLFFFVFFSLSLSQSSAQSFWEPLNGPQGAGFRDIGKNSTGKIFALLGDKIMLSTDNGMTWQICMNGIPDVYSSEVGFLIQPDGDIFLVRSNSLYKYDDANNLWVLKVENARTFAQDLNGRIWKFTYPNIVAFSDDDGDAFQSMTLAIAPSSEVKMAISSPNTNLLLANYVGITRLYNFSWTGEVQEISDTLQRGMGFKFNPYTGTVFRFKENENMKRSIDGGQNWHDVNVPNQVNLNNIIFLNDSVSLAITRAALYRSIDDGLNWTIHNPNIPNKHPYNTNGIRLIDNVLYMYGAYTFVRSTDYGLSWENMDQHFNNPTVTKIRKDPNGYLYASKGFYFQEEISTDDGQTWQPLFISTTDSLHLPVYKMMFTDNGPWFAKTLQNTFYRSTDNVGIWEKINVPNSSDPYCANNTYNQLGISPDGKIYFSCNGKIYHSENHGDSWQQIGATVPFVIYYDLKFTPDGHVFWLDFVGLHHYDPVQETLNFVGGFDESLTFEISPAGHLWLAGYGIDNNFSRGSAVSINNGQSFIINENTYQEPLLTFDADNTCYRYNWPDSIFASYDFGGSWYSIAATPTPSFISSFYVDNEGYLYAGSTAEVIYKSKMPVMNANRITGNVWLDENGDCLASTNERAMPNVAVIAEGEIRATRHTSSTGGFSIAVPEGEYTLHVTPPNALFEACNSPQTVNLSGTGDTWSIDLPQRIAVACPYMTVNIGTNFLRRCFNSTYYINYCNDGTAEAKDAFVYVTLDSLLAFVSATLPLTGQNGQTLRFDLGDVAAGECGDFQLEVYVSCDAELGHLHCTETHIYPDTLCLPSLDSLFQYTSCEYNIGSYDPNDKRAVVNGLVGASSALPGQNLEYIIRFQNTGTDTAFQVVIEDRLAAWLDPLSVVPVLASHPYRMEIHGNNLLRFIFNPIALPDSNINEAASHGFIKFRVKQIADVPLGTTIQNKAAIYFDFNAPVWTNTTEILVDNYSQTTGQVNPNKVLVVPNPFEDVVTFTLPDDDFSGEKILIVRDGLGRFCKKKTFSGTSVEFKQYDLPAGMYFYSILQEDKIWYAGKIVKR